MTEYENSKSDDQLEELLLLTEQMQEELDQKDRTIRELKVQLDESLTLNEKLNSENKTENIQALKNDLRKTKELLQSTFDRIPAFQPVSLLFSDGRVHSPVPVLPVLAYRDIPLSCPLR